MRTLGFAEQALLATDSVQLVSNSVRDELSKRPFESEQSLALRQKIQAPAMGLLFFENAYTIS
jgi:hypothetical protein